MIVQVGEVKYKVSWIHNPNDNPESTWPNKSTVVHIHELTVDSKKAFGWGIAKCSKNDNFNKSKGRIVSLTKAISHLPKDVRTLFFQQYKKEIGFR
jgi:hypothetical protein